MIKINLLAERKPTKAKAPSKVQFEMGGGRNIILIGLMVVGVLVAGGWWWNLNGELIEWRTQLDEADQELKRLEAAIKKGEEYEVHKQLLARKIDLITELKKQQAVPVHILDKVSRSMPEFLWLDTMSASNNNINISGKATTYNAVSNFYSNLTSSGYFGGVTLGRTFEVPEGVSFSITCTFVSDRAAQTEDQQS